MNPVLPQVFLSATLSNSSQFAAWVAHLHTSPCHVVYTDYRPTPLQVRAILLHNPWNLVVAMVHTLSRGPETRTTVPADAAAGESGVVGV